MPPLLLLLALLLLELAIPDDEVDVLDEVLVLVVELELAPPAPLLLVEPLELLELAAVLLEVVASPPTPLAPLTSRSPAPVRALHASSAVGTATAIPRG